MKTFFLLICIALFLGECQSQNTTSDEMGSGVTDTTESPPVICSADTQIVNNLKVSADVSDCGNYTAGDYNITVSFKEADPGTTSVANVTCNKTCDGSGSNRAIGARQCGADGAWSQPTWINCSKTDLSPNDQLDNALIETSNPQDTNGTDVKNAVVALQNVANQSSVDEETANTFMATFNNVLLASGDGAEGEVQDSSDELVATMNEFSQNVDLNSSTVVSYDSYEKSESSVATLVLQQPEPTPARQAGTSNPYFGVNVMWSDPLNLASVELTSTPLSGGYVNAQPAGEQRLSVQMYSNVDRLFSALEDPAMDVAYAVDGTDANEFVMQFQITKNYTVTRPDDNRFNQTTDSGNTVTVELQCGRWNISAWINGSSCSITASNFFAKCTCTEPGVYSIKMAEIPDVEPEEPEEPEDTSLSGGAIAGIVIGSVAGVALIGGGVYYFMNKSKKSSSPTSY